MVALFAICQGVLLEAVAQKGAVMTFKDSVYNFGNVDEEKGSVVCNFGFTNTGDAPLVITRVTSDCGCTSPDWPREAIDPGSTAILRVAFNPLNRPGPFSKNVHIYSNASNGMRTLTIKGDVSTAGGAGRMYPYAIGSLKLTDNSFEFPPVTLGKSFSVRIKSYNSDKDSDIRVRLIKVPFFMKADTMEYNVKPFEQLEMLLHLRAIEGMEPKMYREPLLIEVTESDGSKAQGKVDIEVPFVDDFSGYKSIEDVLRKSPKLAFNTYHDLGEVNDLKTIKVSVPLKNEGVGELKIQDISCTDPAISFKPQTMSIAPGKEKVLKVFVSAKYIRQQGWSQISDNINIICNDPTAPLRKLKIKVKMSKKK